MCGSPSRSAGGGRDPGGNRTWVGFPNPVRHPNCHLGDQPGWWIGLLGAVPGVPGVGIRVAPSGPSIQTNLGDHLWDAC